MAKYNAQQFKIMWNPKYVPRIQKFKTTTKRHFELYDKPTVASGGDQRKFVLCCNSARPFQDLTTGTTDAGNVDGWDHYTSTTKHDFVVCIGAQVTINFDQRYCQGYTLYAYFDDNPTTTYNAFQLENSLGHVYKMPLEEGIGHTAKRSIQIPYKPYYVDPHYHSGNVVENDDLRSSATTAGSVPTVRHWLHVCLVPTHEVINKRLAAVAGDNTECCGIWGQVYLSQIWIGYVQNEPETVRVDDEQHMIMGTDTNADYGAFY